jgi:hypothetical protein
LGHCWVIVFGVFDPDESEHWRGFAGILGQIVIFLLDVMEEIYIYRKTSQDHAHAMCNVITRQSPTDLMTI